MKLQIELVPKTSWYSNLRSELPRSQWDKLRKRCYAAANHRCEICGGTGPRWPVECHEIWNYDDASKTQRLDGLIALCPACHEVKHMGRAEVVGRGNEALKHLAAVNGWTYEQAWEHRQQAFERWVSRSRYQWTLDLSWLEHSD